MELLFADAHSHSNPVKGLGAREIGKRFKKMNGWFMALVSLSPWHYGLSRRGLLESYLKAIELHLAECKRLREEGITVSCFAGFHPADVDKLEASGVRLEEVVELGERVVEHVASLCAGGELDGIGEIGRQHYTTSALKASIALLIMLRALEYARDNDCLVHLHLENHGAATVVSVDKLLSFIGFREKKSIFFHHSSLKVAREAIRLGYSATVPGKAMILENVFRELNPLKWRYVIESDFIDDPSRPCVSQCPWDIIENQVSLFKKGMVSEEGLYKINVDYIVKLYRVPPP